MPRCHLVGPRRRILAMQLAPLRRKYLGVRRINRAVSAALPDRDAWPRPSRTGLRHCTDVASERLPRPRHVRPSHVKHRCDLGLRAADWHARDNAPGSEHCRVYCMKMIG
ncbi:unnamed protein product [Acidocella sp. C78]|nr:unnamed protein product [Acidocella sp. C78]